MPTPPSFVSRVRHSAAGQRRHADPACTTVRDIRLAGKVAGDDAEERELQLFASLAQVSRQDLEGLKLSDYQRLQGAYFRLVQDDTDDTFAYASTGEAPGH